MHLDASPGSAVCASGGIPGTGYYQLTKKRAFFFFTAYIAVEN